MANVVNKKTTMVKGDKNAVKEIKDDIAVLDNAMTNPNVKAKDLFAAIEVFEAAKQENKK